MEIQKLFAKYEYFVNFSGLKIKAQQWMIISLIASLILFALGIAISVAMQIPLNDIAVFKIPALLFIFPVASK